MLHEEEIAARRERARTTILKILSKPAGHAYGDYQVQSSSGKTYRVALRGPGVFDNFCSCPDFAVNTLGTCKHIEALLLEPRKRAVLALMRGKFRRTRASLSLHYGETLAVRLRIPEGASPALRRIATDCFDRDGFLGREHFRPRAPTRSFACR